MNSGYGSFQVSTNIFIPQDEEQERIRLIEYLREHAEAINRREVSTYDQTPSPTGQQWPSVTGESSQRRQSALRKLVNIVIDHGASPQTFPHDINTSGVVFTLISGVIGNSVDSFLPVPFPGSDEVLVQVDDANVIITTSSSTWNNFTGSIVLEWLPSSV